MKINNKKAVELSINTIVIISIALITLVAVTLYFFGGFKKTGGAVEEVSSGTAEETSGLTDMVKSVRSIGTSGEVFYCCGWGWNSNICWAHQEVDCSPSCDAKCQAEDHTGGNMEYYNTPATDDRNLRCHCYD